MKTRKLFSKFRPYVWEMSTAEIASAVGVRPSDIIRMDTNTSPYAPRNSIAALLRNIVKLKINDYPDTSYISLRNGLSEYCKKSVESFVISNGADEALDIITKTLLDPHDEVIVPNPSYSMFRVASEVMGAKVVSVPRNNDFGLDLRSIKKRVNKRTKIIFLCSPNNPTGNTVSQEEVESLLELPGNHTVVIDEAYFEFCGKTVAELTNERDNLLVVRTFSKAFSMAGVRVGYIIASPDSVKKLNIVRPPNSLGVTSLFLAQSALEDKMSMISNVKAIVAERENLIKVMSDEKELQVFPSEANFVLFKLKSGESEDLHNQLLKKGFVLRNFSGTRGIESCLRVTVNTPEVNQLFLKELLHAIHTIH